MGRLNFSLSVEMLLHWLLIIELIKNLINLPTRYLNSSGKVSSDIHIACSRKFVVNPVRL
jgi:hypothetical protein